MNRTLTDHWTLGGVRIPNRVVLAPLAGIGNWFVRLQAKRYGAGLVVSEMVSSFAVHYRNERTCRELLRIHPDEHPVSMQLFGHDPDVMASAAERVAEAGADLIDLNMGCPVPKVCKTGAGAALLEDPARAVALARAAAKGSGLPVTVKLRTGLRPGDRQRRRGRAGACARRLRRGPVDPPPPRLPAPQGQARLRARSHARGGAAGAGADLRRAADAPTVRARRSSRRARPGVLLARGSLGNPWLFEELLGRRAAEPDRDEILAELDWVIDVRARAPGRRARDALPAQVLPLVHRAAGAAAGARETAAGGASDRAEPRGSGRFAARRARPRGPRGVDPPALGEPARAPPTPL